MTRPEVAIIGAGPVGLFAVFECGMLGLKCHVIDSLEMIGGQCSALYPEKPIYDIPAFPSINAHELITRLEEQALPFQPSYHLGQQVTELTACEDGFHLKTNQGTVLKVKGVIIAAGVGAFGPNRPPLKGLEEFEGTSVFYHVRRREDFRGKRIVIAGGGDSAVDWALSLVDLAEKIWVVHRRAKFRAAPESEARLKALHTEGRLELVIPYQLEAIEGAQGQCNSVIVKNLEGEVRSLPADTLLPFYGLSMNLGPIAEWGFNLEHHHILVNPATCQTNQKGIFAIGDIATYPGKLKLILTGFSEAALAAHSLRHHLFPDEVRHFEYSTTMGVPGKTERE